MGIQIRKSVYALAVVVILFFAVAISDVSVAQTTVPGPGSLIVDCSFGEGEDCGIKHLFTLTERILDVLIWLAGILFALVMLRIGVVFALNAFLPGEYQSAINKSKAAFQGILLGLFLVLGAWLIVKAVFTLFGYKGDPFNAPVQPTTPPPPSTTTPPPSTTTPPPPPSPDGCSSCVSLADSGLRHKPSGDSGDVASGCSSGTDGQCYINQELYERLVKLNEDSEDGTPHPWRITESWPPTTGHANTCHQDGTCVDVGFFYATEHRPPATGKQVYDFIVAARSEGLTAEYEVPNEQERSRLIRENPSLQGLHRGIIIVREVTPHFSVYRTEDRE